MASNYILVLICSLFSFACALLKQLYDVQYYPKNMYVFMIDVALSGVSGIVLGFILSETMSNELAIIGFSGMGGMFGVNALKSLMKYQLGQKLNIEFPEESDDGAEAKKRYVCEKDSEGDHYSCVKDLEHENNPPTHMKIIKKTEESD